MASRSASSGVERTVAHARTLLGAASSEGIDPAARTVASIDVKPSLPPRARPPLPEIDVGDGEDAELGLRRVLGEGGMGIVHLARQRSLERDVALKRIKPEVAVDATHVAALLDEAVTMGSLEHPSIVPVHVLGRDETGQPVLVMKKVEGVPLSTLVRDAEHPGWARVRGDRAVFYVETAMKLSDALSFAHSRGVLHRDVKPDNVMIGEFGEVYLLDWGIAGRLGSMASSICGTPVYMAPEMLAPGSAPLDARTDVYLLAATLHECVAGKPPHSGPTLDSVLFSIARSDPHDYGNSVPPDLAEILHSAMHADFAQRPPSMAALRELLSSHLGHRAAAALATSARARLEQLEELVPRTPPDPLAIHAAFDACRFGLEEALRGWPQNARARDDLERALGTMARFQIRQRNRGDAAALMAAMRTPPADLEADLRHLDEALARDEGERARLSRLDHDLDQDVSIRQRVVVARVVAGVLAFASLGFVALEVLHVYEPTPVAALLAMIPLTLISLVALWIGRRAFFRNRVNRHMTLTLGTILVAIFLERIGAIARDHSVGEMVAADALIIATGAGVASLSIRRLYTIPAAAFGAASLVAAFRPETGPYPALVAGVVTVAAFGALRNRMKAPWLDAFGDAPRVTPRAEPPKPG